MNIYAFTYKPKTIASILEKIVRPYYCATATFINLARLVTTCFCPVYYPTYRYSPTHNSECETGAARRENYSDGGK